MKEMIIYTAVAAIMLVCAVVDIKKKEISIWLLGVLGIIVIIGCVVLGNQTDYTMAAGIIPGILLIILAKITEQSIGYGDGIILAEIGLVTGLGKCVLILAVALAMAGVFSLAIVVIRKVNKKYKIPFVPFLTMAYLAVLCLQNKTFIS